MQLGANAAARQGRKSASVTSRNQPPRRFDERFERQPIAFVVVFALLIPIGRPQPYLAAHGLHEVHAEAMQLCGRG